MMYEVSFFHALKESSRTTMSTTVIVGAGFAGLYTALKLGSRDITIVDRRSKPGGRARTATEDGGVLYEQGPWRVHQSHDLFIKLCREFDMPLEPNSSSLSGGGRPDGPDRLESYFDRGILEKGLVDAQRAENASGYTGADIGPYGSYRTSSLDGRFLVLGGGGFEELARRMAAKLAERGVSIRYGFLVEDVVMEEGEYRVHYRTRESPPETLEVAACKRLILAVPARSAAHWTIARRWLRSQTSMVVSIPLHHIYVQACEAGGQSSNSSFHIKTGDELGQIISGDYGERYFQISYTAGRVAEFWNRLRLSNPEKFGRVLRERYEKHRERHPQHLPRIDWEAPVKSHFWRHAVHRWVPTFSGDTETLMRRSVEPHPIALPNLYWVGECFSDRQGWVEGALRTSRLALRRMLSRDAPALPRGVRFYPDEWVIVDGRVLDVSLWKRVHPGSSAAIEKRLGTDVSRVFRHIDHTDFAWAMTFSLQVCWV